jgi:drug/metabolite transporter (DMT)-like permease
LAWLFLDEPLTGRQILGIALVGMGTLIVQVWRNSSKLKESSVRR